MKKSNTFNGIVYNLLRTLPVKNDSMDWNGCVGIKCPYCGHTDKSANSTHMNIKFDKSGESFPVYHCVKCDQGGLVTSRFLDDLGLYDSDITYLESAMRINISKRVGEQGLRHNKVKNIKILPPLNNNITLSKIKYVENRLGIKLTTEDMIKYKMIFNMKDFLSYNNIKQITRDKRIIDALDEKYIGFLSAKNEFINFRNITEEYDKYQKRYINYNIFGLEDNTRRFYIISSNINIMETVTVVIAEGVFDILGIYNHVYNKREDNIVYVAALGAGYSNVIKYLNKLGIIFANYVLFSDSTEPLNKYKTMKKELDYRVKKDKIDVYYNTLSKDCGVPKDKIRLTKYSI